MKSRDFCYWLQGYFEVADPGAIRTEELLTIKNHLALVFKHDIDPGNESDPVKREELQRVHDGRGVTFPRDSDGKITC